MKFLSRWSPVAMCAAMTIGLYRLDGLSGVYLFGCFATTLLGVVKIIEELSDP